MKFVFLEDEYFVARSIFANPQNADTRINLPWHGAGNSQKSLDRLQQQRHSLCPLYQARSRISRAGIQRGYGASTDEGDGGVGYCEGSPERLLRSDSVPRILEKVKNIFIKNFVQLHNLLDINFSHLTLMSLSK